MSDDSYGSTDVIKYLTNTIAHEVYTKFQRNTHVSYLLIDHAGSLYAEINKLISEIDASSDLSYVLDRYVKYTAAVDPLEKLLFEWAVASEEEVLYLTEQPITAYIASTTTWEDNRRRLRDRLQSIRTNTNLSALIQTLLQNGDAITEAEKHDDNALLEGLTAEIKKERPSNTFIEGVSVLVEGVRTTLDLILRGFRRSTNDDVVKLTIKTTMLVHGVLDISGGTTSDEKSKQHLMSQEVWNAAKDLLQSLQNVLDTASADTADIQGKYNDFLKILQRVDASLPQNYIQLLQKAGKIRRPFFAQALALVSICRALADKFTEMAEKTVEKATPLETAFTYTLTVLEAAVKAVSDIKAMPSFDLETSGTKTALDGAKTTIETCLNAFGMQDRWTQFQNDLTQALAADEACVETLKKRLATSPVDIPNSSPFEVTVKVYGQDKNSPVDSVKMTVDRSTLLSAVLWSAAKDVKPEQRDSVLKITSFRSVDGKCDGKLHRTVGMYAADDTAKECELNLDLPSETQP